MLPWIRCTTGRKVIVHPSGGESPAIHGTICGRVTEYALGDTSFDLYPVELEPGFWSVDGTVFVSILLVNPDNMEERLGRPAGAFSRPGTEIGQGEID